MEDWEKCPGSKGECPHILTVENLENLVAYDVSFCPDLQGAPDLPKISNDKLPYTPLFYFHKIEAQPSQYRETFEKKVEECEKKVNSSLAPENIEDFPPQPRKKKGFCQLCGIYYPSYIEHILEPYHTRLVFISNRRLQEYIEESELLTARIRTQTTQDHKMEEKEQSAKKRQNQVGKNKMIKKERKSRKAGNVEKAEKAEKREKVKKTEKAEKAEKKRKTSAKMGELRSIEMDRPN